MYQAEFILCYLFYIFFCLCIFFIFFNFFRAFLFRLNLFLQQQLLCLIGFQLLLKFDTLNSYYNKHHNDYRGNKKHAKSIMPFFTVSRPSRHNISPRSFQKIPQFY